MAGCSQRLRHVAGSLGARIRMGYGVRIRLVCTARGLCAPGWDCLQAPQAIQPVVAHTAPKRKPGPHVPRGKQAAAMAVPDGRKALVQPTTQQQQGLADLWGSSEHGAQLQGGLAALEAEAASREAAQVCLLVD
jgi:hypothetical protein